MAEPTNPILIWAAQDVNLPQLAGPNKKAPIDDLIQKGWDKTQKPAADEFNYILNNHGQWLDWLKQSLDAGTPLNTPDTLVRRDSSGNFSANNITSNLTGIASKATQLEITRNFSLYGNVTSSAVPFNGTGNVALNTTVVSVSNAMSILTGYISNGGTIPLPSGYTEGQCYWTASIKSYYDTAAGANQSWSFSGRTITGGGDLQSFYYIIIGIK